MNRLDGELETYPVTEFGGREDGVGAMVEFNGELVDSVTNIVDLVVGIQCEGLGNV